MKYGLLLLSFCVLVSCSSVQVAQNPRPSKAYLTAIDKFTIKDELYSGFSNVFHYQASLLTEEIREMQTDYFAKVNSWSEEEIKKSQQQNFESLANETVVFLSFYTPEIQYNDLHLPSSVWRVFLDVAGKRYTGRVTKLPKPHAVLGSIYPKHSPWGYPYEVSFPVSYREIKDLDSKLVITGSLGISERKFPR